MYCKKCGAEMREGTMFCPNCGTNATAVLNNNSQRPAVYQPELPMKWYKFLIYFAVFAGAVINTINGFTFLTGSQYGAFAELVYAAFENMKMLDVVYGILCLAVAAFGFYVRFRLSGFYKDGPKLLLMLYAAGAVVSLIYLIGTMILVPGIEQYLNFGSIIGSLAMSVVMIFANKKYFDNRAHLFVD